jgi:hypothetical protein
MILVWGLLMNDGFEKFGERFDGQYRNIPAFSVGNAENHVKP